VVVSCCVGSDQCVEKWRVGLFGVHMNGWCWFSKFRRGRGEKVVNE